MKIALVDYGIGNLRSVAKALEAVGAKVQRIEKAEDLQKAQKIVLPGVGAFGRGMEELTRRNFVAPLQEAATKNIPILGICLGMQLFFQKSEEAPNLEGLNFLEGEVKRFPAGSLPVPHTGWNQLQEIGDSPLTATLPEGAYAYFNHSYYCLPSQEKDILARTNYLLSYASIVQRGSIYGVQFHPEKSQSVGLLILKNFVERC